MINRYLYSTIYEQLDTLRQMVFLVGPRQVGKTTLAKRLIPKIIEGVNYFNWDIPEHKKILMKDVFTGKLSLSGNEKGIIVFDEIHKYPRWKNTIKGLFDKYEPNAHWLITGSALMNVYKKGQDSLLGRSFSYGLAPFSVAELINAEITNINTIEVLVSFAPTRPCGNISEIYERLNSFGGFPEPYLNGGAEFLAKWRTARLDRLVNQDLAGTENLKNLPLVENLMYLLPERVGSPLSLNSLREELEVHFATVKHWMELLERTFYGFMIRPFAGKLARSLKKDGKWYLWDWTEIPDAGNRFENLVAVHLIKYVHFMNDTGRDNLSLHYARDKEKREVDFVITRNKEPLLLIECKLNDESPHSPLAYFAERLKTKRAIQLVSKDIEPRRLISKNGVAIDIMPAASFLSQLV